MAKSKSILGIYTRRCKRCLKLFKTPKKSAKFCFNCRLPHGAKLNSKWDESLIQKINKIDGKLK